MSVKLIVCGKTDVGLVRSSNEDTFVIADLTGGSLPPAAEFAVRERGVLMAVSDGMGGEKAGEVASAMVVASLQRAMAQGAAYAPDALLETAVASANRDVWQAAHVPGRTGMGATLTAVFIRGATAYIAEVGDSRAYLLRGGALVQVTRDQSFVQLLIERGALTPEEAARSPMRNIIVQAMGTKPDVSVALGKLDLCEGDRFLLCSDGLSNELSTDDMRQVILGSPQIDVACAKLIDLAKRKGGADNITVIVGSVSGGLPLPARRPRVSKGLEVLKEFDGARLRG